MSPPSYIFDMLDVEQRGDFKPNKIMGWTPISGVSKSEMDALTGIGFLRGICDFEDIVSRTNAIERLRTDDVLFSRVKAFFPFLDLSGAEG